jgi:3-oxoacyl-[acyl-carrier-protein] synthase-1
MKRSWIVSDAVISPLGKSTATNFEKIQKGISGITAVNDTRYSTTAFYAAAMTDALRSTDDSSRFEALCEASIRAATWKGFPFDRALMILSTTKGNISFLEEGRQNNPRIRLPQLAAYLSQKFGFADTRIVSNACISGVLAIIVAKRLLDLGHYDHAVVVGADTLSRFIVSGFQSLQAISDEPCRPFDIKRKGITLGECSAAIVITSNPEALAIEDPSLELLGGSVTNDANHISGPSRSGNELAHAVSVALEQASLSTADIDFISAHGTATLYNDEMEAKAFNLAGMQEVPLNSLKGYFGHTLGAAGVVETIMCGQSLLRNELIATMGFESSGVTQPLNVIAVKDSRPLKTCLKTASGFGGCNAALIIQKTI